MARKLEIERKFLIHRRLLPPLPEGARLAQGYLSQEPNVRVRAEECGALRKGYLTIKAPGLVGRDEFEYEIPHDEATALLSLCRHAPISKTRYRLPVEGNPELTWELDLFDGANEGLAVVELELPAEDHPYPRPSWLGREVTENPAYKNSALALHPYRDWSDTERQAP